MAIKGNLHKLKTPLFWPIFKAILALSFGTVLLLPVLAEAADLRFSPSGGTYKVGRNFKVSIIVNSAEQAMNAAEGRISFPTDKLKVIDVSRNGSVFNLWVRDPSFSNAGSLGNVRFEGVVLNPGFRGSSAKILDIVFQAIAPGTASVNFSSGAVLANDGDGTNITSSLGSAIYTLTRAVIVPEIKEPSEPPPPPTIDFFPSHVVSPGESVIVGGTALPDITVEVHMDESAKEDEEIDIIFSARSNQEGAWEAVYSSVMPSGRYEVTARQILEDGTVGLPSPPVYISVNALIWVLLQWLKNIGLFIIILIILLLLALLVIYYFWHKLQMLRLRLRKEAHEAHEKFKRGIANAEREVAAHEDRAKIIQDLKKTEREVDKEIQDIEDLK